MDLSIIIPHYESVQCLKKLLDSIPQSDNIETIVVDDKSNAQIEDWNLLKKEYNASNILFLENKCEKKGAGVCRNIALQYAKGTWLLFADADDYFVEGMQAALEPYLRNQKDMVLKDIIYFPPTSINIMTGETSRRHIGYAEMIRYYRMSGNKNDENALRYSYNSPCSKLIRRNMVVKNKISFDEVMVSNDVMFSVKCGYYAREIAVSDKVIYCITYNGSGLTSKRDFNAVWIRLCVLGDKCEFLRERLSRHDFSNLPLSCYYYYIYALKARYSLSEVRQITKQIINKRIPLISFGLVKRKLRKLKYKL